MQRLFVVFFLPLCLCTLNLLHTVSTIPLRCLVTASNRNTVCVPTWTKDMPKAAPVWYYDGIRCATDNRSTVSRRGDCRCENDANAFGSRFDCEETCGGEGRLPAAGRCTERFERGFRCACSRPGRYHYYDSGRNACLGAVFRGCGHTANRFATMGECAAVCIEGGPDLDGRLPPSCGTLADVTIPVLSGWDTSEYENAVVWNYDANETQCVERTAVPVVGQNCLSDNNQFASRYDCEQTCKVDNGQAPAARCGERRNRGVRCTCAPAHSAGAGRQQWYYDSARGRCRPLRYRGCGGNGNRFAGEAHCAALCVGHGNSTSTAAVAVDRNYGADRRTTAVPLLLAPVLIRFLLCE